MKQTIEENGKISATDDPLSHQQLNWAWLLWANRRFIARLVSIGVAAGLILAVAIPSRYTATTQLMPPDSVGGSSLGMAAIAAGMSDKAGGLGTAAADLLGFKSSGALFVSILKSRTVQDRIVERFELQKAYGHRHRIDARLTLSKNTDILEDRKSGVIRVDVTDRDGERARQIANAYVEELNRVVANSAMSAAGRERAFIEERMWEVRKEMNESASELADFSSKNSTLDLKEQARAMLDAVATVQGQLIAAQSELKGLQSIYTDENYRVRAVKAQVLELSRQMNSLQGSTSGTHGGSVIGYPTIRQLPGLGVRFEDLYRRKKVAEAVYEALVQQYEMSKIQEAKDTPKVQLLDSPERPELKSYPPRIAMVLGAFLLSLSFASGWVLAGEYWDRIDEDDRNKRLLNEIKRTLNVRVCRSSVALRVSALIVSTARKIGLKRADAQNASR